MESFLNFFSSRDFMPHIHCYLAKPELTWTMFTTDLIIGLAYVAISISLYSLVKKINLPFTPMFFAFGIFIFACGLTHFMEIYNLWVPNYWLAAFIKIITALASITTAFYLIQISPKILKFAVAAKDSEQRGIDLAQQTAMLIKTNEELKNTQNRFRLFIDGVKDYAIFSLDPEGRITTWNEGGRRLTLFSSNEVLDKHYSIFYSKDEIKNLVPVEKLNKAVEFGQLEEECVKTRKDGSQFWARDLITAIYDNQVLSGFTVVIRDMTEEKLADEKLKSAFDELEQRVRERTFDLEAAVQNRDEFLSVASHELKTPLTSTYMQLQLLDRRLQKMVETATPPTEVDREKLNICLLQSSKLSSLIDELLDLTRIRGGRLNLDITEVNLSLVVKETVDSLGEQLKKNHDSITIQFDQNESYIGYWDKLRIEQVVTNLISNALKYGQHKPITITLKKDSHSQIIKFIIHDQGIGISKELQHIIFERFARGSYDNKISGLGLGLYITKQIVLAHKGDIQLESVENRGSTFEVSLPVRPEIDPQFKGESSHGM